MRTHLMKLRSVAFAFFLTGFSAGAFADPRTESGNCEGHLQPLALSKQTLSELSEYRSATWLRYVDHISELPSGYETHVDLVGVASLIPDALKNQIYQKIKANYGLLTKISIKPWERYPIAPKRAIDALVTQMNHPHPLFREKSQKMPASHVYVNYIFDLQEKTMDWERGYGTQNPATLLSIYKKLSQELKRYQIEKGLAQTPTLFIAGSLPNGRSHRTKSDIDASLNPRDPELVARLQKIVWNAFHLKEGLEFGLFDIGSKGHLAWNSQVNPLNVYITADQVELWIYPVMKIEPPRLYLEGWNEEPDKYQL